MKNFLLLMLLLVPFILSACTQNPISQEDVLMNELASDGQYHYSNKDLGFSVSFPEQFIYYQVQRTGFKERADIEFFVPTSDKEYPQPIQSYGKFLTIVVYDSEVFAKLSEEDKLLYTKLGEKKQKVYLATFWDKSPNDWIDKWSEDVRNKIISSFKINQ